MEKEERFFVATLNSKNDMTGASRKIWILIYPHPSDARESQKDTPFLFFLFRRQRVSKGVLILLFSAAPVALPVLPA